MKKVICIVAIVGILIGLALFINSLSVSLDAKEQEGYYGWAIDLGPGSWYCYPCKVVTCWSRGS